MDIESDLDTVVYQGLRIYRNALFGHIRSRLLAARGSVDVVDAEIQALFQKEWPGISASAAQAFETGRVERKPVDALDHLGTAHVRVLLEKYWDEVCPESVSGEHSKKARAALVALATELNDVRNPISHSPAAGLSRLDALRYLDTGCRALEPFDAEAASRIRVLWSQLLREQAADTPAPMLLLDSLPSRETITSEFVGREDQLSDLWRWTAASNSRLWVLVGDGGKGKTTIAYEFASGLRGALNEFGLQGILWLSAKQRRFVDGKSVSTTGADFSTLEEAVDWILASLGWDEDQALALAAKKTRCLELLSEFPMLIVADDLDSLEAENEDAIAFFTHEITAGSSKVLITSRRKLFGLGGVTTQVSGLTESEVARLITVRAPAFDLDPDAFTPRRIREIRSITDGSPLYIEDFLRLSQFYSIQHSLDQWSGKAGEAAREYSLKRELEKLTPGARSILGVLAYAEGARSVQECAVVAGLPDDAALSAMEELRSWNLLPAPSLVEDVPAFACTRNLAKLMRSSLSGTDEEKRIRNGLAGLRGIAVGSARTKRYIQQAVALQRSGQREGAEATLRAGLDEVPNSGEVFAMLGWLYSKWAPTVRAADARDCFEKAEAFGQRNRDLYGHWAELEFHAGEFRRAVELCERSVAGAGSRDPFTWRLLGRGLVELARGAFLALSTEQSGEFATRARLALERAHEFSASDSDLSRTFKARLDMARVLGDGAEVGRVLEEWAVALPDDPFRSGVRV